MTRCPRQYCHAAMSLTTDGNGSVLARCEYCDRNAHGWCRDCWRRLSRPQALRCPSCSSARTLARVRDRSRAEYADPVQRRRKLAQQKRAHAALSPEQRRAKYVQRQAWRHAIPGYSSHATKKWRHRERAA